MNQFSPPVSEEVKRQRIEAYHQYGSVTKAAISLGISRKALSKSLKRWGIKTETQEVDRAVRGEIGGPRIPYDAIPPEGFVIRRNSGQYDAKGNLERQWIESGQGTAEGYEVPTGHVVKGESTLLDANGHVLAKWIKTREDPGGDLIEAFRSAFAEYEGCAPYVAPPIESDDDLLCVYPLPDLHFGLLAWDAETKGGDYDMSIATKIAIDSLENLVARSPHSKHAVLLGLGDYLHVDNQTNATPGSGHQLDADSRFAKIFAAGAKLVLKMVEIIARKHDTVEVRFLSGNHDITSAMCLTVALSLFYSGNERIKVNTDPGIAWYRRHGKCLIGATHGHTVKMDRLAGMMAADRPEDWGLSKHRSFLTGHVHTETVKEVAGVRIESLQAPAARDAWNASSGYRSGRSLSAITFHTEEGEIGRHRVNIQKP